VCTLTISGKHLERPNDQQVPNSQYECIAEVKYEVGEPGMIAETLKRLGFVSMR
jgi:hypothetical protein